MVVEPNTASAEITDQERTQLLLKIQELIKIVQALQLQLKNKTGEESALKNDSTLPNKEKNNIKVELELVSTNTKLIENNKSSISDDEGLFEITFSAKAIGGDAFIYSSYHSLNDLEYQKSGGNISINKYMPAINYRFETLSGSKVIPSSFEEMGMNLESKDAELTIGKFLIPEDEEKNFTLWAKVNPKEAESYRFKIETPLTFFDSSSNSYTVSVNKNDLVTDYVVFPGSERSMKLEIRNKTNKSDFVDKDIEIDEGDQVEVRWSSKGYSKCEIHDLMLLPNRVVTSGLSGISSEIIEPKPGRGNITSLRCTRIGSGTVDHLQINITTSDPEGKADGLG